MSHFKNHMEPIQKALLKDLKVDISCAINREIEKFQGKHPEMKIAWLLTMTVCDDKDREWLANIKNQEWHGGILEGAWPPED